MTEKIAIGALLVFLINIPFGYWRAKEVKKSFKWFLYIHLPIPLVIAIRLILEIGFAIYSYPIFIFAFFLGQLTGGIIHKIYRK
ncbi:MAG: hypothetical protein JXR60_08190 [Bacteroidales bacterium]|nr:hypothetical protein [Bacteroidales bacterium]